MTSSYQSKLTGVELKSQWKQGPAFSRDKMFISRYPVHKKIVLSPSMALLFYCLDHFFLQLHRFTLLRYAAVDFLLHFLD